MQLHPTKLILAALGPFLVAGSAWLTAAVAKYGVHLDPSGVNALAVAGATGALALVAKLIHDIDRHAPRAGAAIATAAAAAETELETELTSGWPPAPAPGS